MAITSVGYDGTVDERQFRDIMGFSASSEYGVVEPSGFAASSVAGQVLQVRLTAGTAWTAGVVDKMDTAETVQLEPVSSGSVRWDMIVLRRDYQPPGGTTSLRVVKGSASMTLPSRQKSVGVLDEQPLWLVKLEAGKSNPVQFIDLRVWARNGGCTANHDLVRSYLNGVGTGVEINGAVWLLRVGTNGQSEWRTLSKDSHVPLVDTATFLSTGNSLMKRHHTGSVQVETGSHPKDATNREYVDPLKQKLDAATFELKGGTVVQRHASGAIQVETGAHPKDAANKDYVDFHIQDHGHRSLLDSASRTQLLVGNDKVTLGKLGATPVPLASEPYVNDLVDSLLHVMPITISGNVTITPKANTPTSVNVNLPTGMFRTAPNIVATADSTAIGDAVKGVSVSDIDATGFRLWVHRTNTTPTKVYWIATN